MRPQERLIPPPNLFLAHEMGVPTISPFFGLDGWTQVRKVRLKFEEVEVMVVDLVAPDLRHTFLCRVEDVRKISPLEASEGTS